MPAYVLPPLGGNPSSHAQGTNPGSFARQPDLGGPLTFSSPDAAGMPAPSDETAWSFLPPGWRRDSATGFATAPPGFEPVTQLEHARLGRVTKEMRRVAEREGHLSARAGARRSRRRPARDPRQPGAPRRIASIRWGSGGPLAPR